jgi:hypothetical protein
MSLEKTKTGYLRSEHFLTSVAPLLPGCGGFATGADLELIVRRLAEFLSRRLAAKDLDSVLAVLEDTLTREAQFVPRHSKTTVSGGQRTNLAKGIKRDEKLDPHFWG